MNSNRLEARKSGQAHTAANVPALLENAWRKEKIPTIFETSVGIFCRPNHALKNV
jgi:hypothetical protein